MTLMPPPATSEDSGLHARIVLREAIALVLILGGLITVAVGAYMVDPGLALAVVGALVVGVGYLLGRE